MSVFRNVRIYPDHGSRSAVITWEIEPGVETGDVYVAFSESGTSGSWHVDNPADPVPSDVGMYLDDALVMNAGTADGYYRLLLSTASGNDFFSEPFQILGDITPREYGIIRGIIHREYTMMRVTNGFPIWHCIPKTHGEPSDSVDPDTGKPMLVCDDDLPPEEQSYGLPYKGGYYPPILTWMQVLKFNEGLKDDPKEFSTKEIDKTAVRLMCFPRPRRGHLIVDPATDRRWLVGDEIKPYRFRGVIPIAYNATLEHLKQSDQRYKFPTPAFDTKAYRKIPYWTVASVNLRVEGVLVTNTSAVGAVAVA